MPELFEADIAQANTGDQALVAGRHHRATPRAAKSPEPGDIRSLPPLDEKVDHVRGSATGRLIIEYGDYECPYSRQAFQCTSCYFTGTPTLFIHGVVHRGGYDPPALLAALATTR